ncbi:MAG: CRISPR-associated endonuclease Cas1 [Hahellaceae bacterium]|nr:CRISPR-associated endonuclease Cas1 [Hahellaceae bacterium]
MSNVLVLDRRGTRLDAEGQHLIVRNEKFDRPRSVPIAQIEQVIALCSLDLSTTVLGKLSSQQIGFTFIPNGKTDQAWFQIGDCSGNVHRKIMQAQAWQNDDLCEYWGARLVKARIQQQARLLQRLGRSHPEVRYPSLTASGQLRELARQAEGRRRAELLGLEGAAAAVYFGALKQHFADSWQFQGRNRRPPKDPVNVMLSLGYTLMTAITVRALLRNGLDPLLGFYHQPSYGRPSLACDLVELMRCHVDAWVVDVCAKQTLTADYFKSDDKGCHLGKAGRGHFYKAWGGQAVGYAHLANRIAMIWRRRLEAWYEQCRG